MKSFEERYTAWLDGAMDAREREKFETGELPESARSDAADWAKLRGLMREALAPESMPHGEFVSSQVLAAIERETPRPQRAAGFPVGRLAWAGASLLALALVLSAVIVPSLHKRPTNEQFISQVVKTRSGNPGVNAYSFAAPGGKGTVLWLDNAGDIPADERIK